MPDGGNERRYAKFAEKVKALGLDVAVGAAGKPGDLVIDQDGASAPFAEFQDRLFVRGRASERYPVSFF
jgi:hypothetical protein